MKTFIYLLIVSFINLGFYSLIAWIMGFDFKNNNDFILLMIAAMLAARFTYSINKREKTL